MVVAVGGAAFLVLLADQVLLLFGPDYATEGAALLRIVALTAIPAAILNTYFGALRVTKRLGELVVIASAISVTTLAGAYVLLPEVGIIGAGIAHSIGQGLGLTFVPIRLFPSLWVAGWLRLRHTPPS